MSSMLRVENLESGYGPMQVLWKPSLEVEKGSITSLLGPNGVGKTTLLKTILGSVEPSGGKTIYEERDVTHSPTHKKVEMGIVLAPEGKHLFVRMSVHENLTMGAFPKEAIKYMDMRVLFQCPIPNSRWIPNSVIYNRISIPEFLNS